ncbi:MAG: recombinase family protein [Armatimonadota bacterium]
MQQDDFKPKAAAVIIRVSSQGQAKEGLSLEAQEEVTRDIAARVYGVPVVAVYKDAGVSGDLYQTRQGLQGALAGLRAGEFDLLICYDLSRLTWSPEHQPRILREIHETGGRLHVHLMGGLIRPDDHQQEFFAGMQTQSDRFYRRHIRQLSISGHRKAAQEGRQPQRKNKPYGYHIITKNDVIRGTYPKSEEGKYVVVEAEAHFVRLIFQWYAHEGVSLNPIIARLGSAGAATQKGGKWTRSTLSRILSNPAYKGTARYGHLQTHKDESRLGQLSQRMGRTLSSIYYWTPAPESQIINIPCPALVDEATWDRAQARFEENRQLLSGRPDRKYMLTSMMVCPKCGLRMISANNARNGYYYVCRHSTPSRSPDGIVCSTRCFPGLSCERLTAQAVQALVTRKDVILAAIQAWQGEQEREAALQEVPAAEEAGQVADLKERQAKLEARRRDIATNTELERDFVNALLRDVAAELKSVADELKAALTMSRRSIVPNKARSKEQSEVFTRQVVEALVGAEKILMDDRVDVVVKWQILRGLVKEIKPIDSGKPKGGHGPQPEAVEVLFTPIFAGDLSTVAHIKSWRHRDDFVPIFEGEAKVALIEEWRAGRYPSAELLVETVLPLRPHGTALHLASGEEAAWLCGLMDALALPILLPLEVSSEIFPAREAIDLSPHEAYANECRAAGRLLPPPDLPFD